MTRALTILFCAAATSIVCGAERFRADWTKVKPYASAIDKTKGPPQADFSVIQTNGCLVIDVRSLTNAIVKARVDISDKRIAYAGRYMTVRATVSGDGVETCGGLLQGQIDRSDEGRGKKHYWKPSTLPIGESPSVWTKTRLLDPRLGELSFTFELTKRGVYRLEDFELVVAPDPISAYEPGRNYLVNGGAEQGHYATSAVGAPSVRFGTKGGVIEPMKGNRYAGMLKPEVSTAVVHSGSRSFALTRQADEDGRFFFSPVPTVDDRAFVFTFWIKAERRCRFRAGLFVASGAAYEQELTATEAWRKVSLRVPRWGREGEAGLRFYGTVTGVGKAVPFIEPQEATTLWIDDGYATVGTLEGEPTPSPLALEVVREDHARGIYRPGEPVRTTVTVRATTGVKGPLTLAFHLYDWRNREVVAAHRTETLAGEGRLSFVLRPPEGLRGPMTLAWMVTDAAGHRSSVTRYVGVQPDGAALDPRLSVNVMFGSPEQSLAFLREFGIGGARVWGPCRNWELDNGYAYTKLFHAAGIRTLFVLGSPYLMHDGKALRGEALLPADPTDWFARQLALVDAHRGEVDVYEFLNEYNIWKGRLETPDPTRFVEPTMDRYLDLIARFRPLLKAHDPSARLAGCATCSTDLRFIGEFLEKGGGASVDLITEHAYSGNPDCPDYAKKLDEGLAKARAAGVAGWAQTEAGATSCNHLGAGLIDPEALVQTHNDLRNMLIAWAKGLESYSHFQLSTGRMGTDWNLTYLGNGDNAFEDLPKPALFAFRVASDLLHGAPCVGEAKLADGCKAYVFDGGARRVVTVWKGVGASARLTPAAALSGTVWRDAMGNRLAAKDLELSPFPVYGLSSLGAAELIRALSESGIRSLGGGVREGDDASDPNLQLLVPNRGVADAIDLM